MDIQVESHGASQIVRINGKLTSECSMELQRGFDAVLSGQGVRKVIVDLKEVPLIDSSGVGEIIRLFKQVRRVDGKVVLMNPNKKLRDLFLMYRFDRFMEVCDEKDPGRREV
jgi:anti-sigma B factor antagonist